MDWTKRIAKYVSPLVLFALLVFFLPTIASADVAKDATASDAFSCMSSCTGSHAFTITLGTITNGVVAVSTEHNTNITITGITVGAVAASLAKAATSGSSKAEIWYAVTGSNTGSQTITISFSGTMAINDRLTSGAVSMSGADQSSPVDATAATQGGSSSTFSTTVTTLTNKDFIVDYVTDHSNFSPTVNAAQTSIVAAACDTGSNGFTCGSSYRTALATPAGNYTMTWTSAFTETYDQTVVAFKSVSAPSTPAKVTIKSGTVFINSRMTIR